jgi:hypothetical protein
MAAEYVVRVNRRDGVVEIEAPDKEWVAEQLDRLAVVYEQHPGAITGAPHTNAPPTAPPTNGAPGTPAAPRRTRSGRSGRAARNPELEAKLTPDVRAQLQAWRDERENHWSQQPNQAVIVATFLMDVVGTDGSVDEDDLYTVFSVMGWPGPSNYRSVISNARQRKGYFGALVDGRSQLTHSGEQFGRHAAKASK